MSQITYITSDHAGYELKEIIKDFLISEKNIEVIDLGTDNKTSVDYPDYAKKIAKIMKDDSSSRGIAICGSGLGISMGVNRYKHIRGALCNDPYSAMMSRKHNDSNILCMGASTIGTGVAKMIVSIWLDTKFEGGRHQDRINKLAE